MYTRFITSCLARSFTLPPIESPPRFSIIQVVRTVVNTLAFVDHVYARIDGKDTACRGRGGIPAKELPVFALKKGPNNLKMCGQMPCLWLFRY